MNLIPSIKRAASYEAQSSEMAHLVVDDPICGLQVCSLKLWETLYKESKPIFFFNSKGEEMKLWDSEGDFEIIINEISEEVK